MLRLERVSRAFGGIRALEDVSFSIPKGSITGIIGPNGAGKTTLFNIITGIYPPSAGEIHLDNEIVSGLPPEQLAAKGCVRTFQNLELFSGMTVLENVMVGLHTRSRSGFVASALKFPTQVKEERNLRERAMHWLEYTGITELANNLAGSLPFGQGRMVEIARALALEPVLLLMDEPAAGLNSRETVELGHLITKIRELGITVALVEHDMELVMDICEKIVVLNLGQKLAEGTPREIQENPEVISAYLGEE